MVHLLGERAHHAGRLHGHSVVHGWRDHCTLGVIDKIRAGEMIAYIPLWLQVILLRDFTLVLLDLHKVATS